MRSALLYSTLFLALALPGIGLAQMPDSEKPYWQGRYRRVLSAVDAAQIASNQAELRYKEMTHAARTGSGGHRAQGAEREAIKAAVPETQARLEEAQQDLAAFPEVARRAGVPPGWLRQVDDLRADASLDAKRDARPSRSPANLP